MRRPGSRLIAAQGVSKRKSRSTSGPNQSIYDGFSIAHPGYAALPWDEHLRAFVEDRHRWLLLRDTADWTRGGKCNQKADTIGGLTKRLANHESHHIERL